MKKLMISMLAMAAMVSCTNEIENPDQPKIEGNEPVEILMNAGINQVITKTAGVIKPKDLVNDVAFVRSDGTAEPTWTSATLAAVDATIAATSGTITFSPTQYYNINADTKAYMIGYHPQTKGTLSANKVSYSGIDGQQDIMCSDMVSGDKTSNASSSLTPAFKHLLTQLSFQIKAADATTATTWGDVTKIELINQKTSADLTLSSTSTFAFTGEATGSYTIGDTNTSFDSSDATTAVPFGKAIMAEAEQAKYTVKVTTTKYTSGINVDITVGAVASTSYVVTLTFQSSSIAATATIGEWTTGEAGTGTVK